MIEKDRIALRTKTRERKCAYCGEIASPVHRCERCLKWFCSDCCEVVSEITDLQEDGYEELSYATLCIDCVELSGIDRNGETDEL